MGSYRTLLENPANKNPHLLIGLRTPDDAFVELQVRHEDAYVIGFKGADGWYVFDDQKDGWGKPCGVKSNYNQLGDVGTVVLKDLNRLGEFGQFRKGTSTLDKRLCAILFAVTSEAARFATVATYFTGITNGLDALKGGVNFEFLKHTYFNNWANPPEQLMGDWQGLPLRQGRHPGSALQEVTGARHNRAARIESRAFFLFYKPGH